MTRPARVKEADAVDVLLHNVAPEVDRYAVPATDRYAAAEVDRYAAAKPDRYAAAKPDRYAVAKPDRSIRYATGERGTRQRVLKTTIVLVEPPSDFKGDMLYMPASEFERAYEYEYSSWMDLWQIGHVLNFSEAAETAWDNQGAYGRDNVPWLLSATVVSAVSDTFESQSEIWGDHDSPVWPEAMALGRKIRAKLVADPNLVLACLQDYGWAGIVAGTHSKNNRPQEADVLAALQRSTSKGLGAAAIDLIVWHGSDLLPESQEMCDLLEMIKEYDFVPEIPVENFVFDSADLHNGTQRVEGSYSVWYEMFGEYVVVGSEYHSDCARTMPFGWRNCRLAPTGSPALPEFKGLDGSPKYPQAFVDKAQGSLFDEV